MVVQDINNEVAAPDQKVNPPQIEENQHSFSLDPKLKLLRSLSSVKLRFINYLNKVDTGETRFGSCNEFTLGINDGAKKKEEAAAAAAAQTVG